MRFLSGEEEKEAVKWMEEAAHHALRATCMSSHCGSVIVKEKNIIGAGYNSPPLDKPITRCIKDSLHPSFKSERHCCVHAEERAIMEALKNYPLEISGSRLYFIRLDLAGKRKFAGKPSCTICSKLALDSRISEFVLWHQEGICVYDTAEYNDISFAYRE
ncbi:MAG: hypothetical protein KJ574_03110 [Nanoarchaeota archaeon]|nr:hypothetical protein [Nanoarchaeota archaeon]